MMDWTRRGVLGSFAAALLAPVPAIAGDDERQALIDHLRQCVLGFDVVDVLKRASRDLGIPGKWVDRATALFAGKDTAHGFQSLADLDEDEAFMLAAETLFAEASDALSMKLALLRAAKRAPATDEARAAMLDHVYAAWFGMDLPRIRTHVATYEPGLLVVVGPSRVLPELGAAFAREPFVRYLELVHGRRAREWVYGRDDERDLFTALLDPELRIAAFVGHGAWDRVSWTGYDADPTAIAASLCTRLREDPRKTLPALIRRDARALAIWPVRRPALTEADLQALVNQSSPGAPPKDLVVRYTCGGGRYRIDGAHDTPGREELVWELLPDEIRDQMYIDDDGAISASEPGLDGAWEPPLAAWLDGHRVALAETVAFGTCLVPDPTCTRGYAGLSWTQHFFEDPVPAWIPPYVWPGGEVVAEVTATPVDPPP
jgi:hypothetical protein